MADSPGCDDVMERAMKAVAECRKADMALNSRFPYPFSVAATKDGKLVYTTTDKWVRWDALKAMLPRIVDEMIEAALYRHSLKEAVNAAFSVAVEAIRACPQARRRTLISLLGHEVQGHQWHGMEVS